MMFLIHTPQSIEGQMRVHLRRRNIRMAQNGLYGAQVSAIFYHVSGAGVPQHVRRGMPPGGHRSLSYHLPDALPGQLAAAICNKQERRTGERWLTYFMLACSPH